MISGVFIDKASKHATSWAVVWNDALLPVRFSTEDEARGHLFGLQYDTGLVSPRLPDGVPFGVSLNPRKRSAA